MIGEVPCVIKKILIGASITIGAGLVMAATGWNFLATANMSDKFIQKSDFATFADCNERDHDRINDKLDKIYEILMQHYSSASASVYETNEEDADYNFRD